MRILINNATIVNEGQVRQGFVIVEDDRIAQISTDTAKPETPVDKTIDASGCYVLPGVIDEHVHFREPGMTAKADIESESRAAAAGGVTSYFDMPNCKPQTTTIDALKDKQAIAAKSSHVNYAFFIGATNDNLSELEKIDPTTVPGVKLFMGSSTGNMLVDDKEALEKIFQAIKMPLMVHCESTAIIDRNMEEARLARGNDPDIRLHPYIRSEEACYRSTLHAVTLAKHCGTRLHVAHLTTAKELQFFSPNNQQITAEAVVGHLYFSEEDYSHLGGRIKVNPAIKTKKDRNALRRAIADGRILTVATDHAPHLIHEKTGGCTHAASGMPMIQFSLPTMLELVDEGIVSIERLVSLMCHNPATLFSVRERGFLREGYKADITIVRPNSPWTVTKDIIQSKCHWSPMEGHTYNWRVEATLCNGHIVYENGTVDSSYIGEPILFR